MSLATVGREKKNPGREFTKKKSRSRIHKKPPPGREFTKKNNPGRDFTKKPLPVKNSHKKKIPVENSQKNPKLPENTQARTIGGPIQCVVSYRDQCAHKYTNMSLY